MQHSRSTRAELYDIAVVCQAVLGLMLPTALEMILPTALGLILPTAPTASFAKQSWSCQLIIRRLHQRPCTPGKNDDEVTCTHDYPRLLPAERVRAATPN